MFDTKTTDFNIMSTPHARDITRQIVQAFRKQGISVGFYFSPDDFWMLHKQGKDVSRRRPEALPVNNPELMGAQQGPAPRAIDELRTDRRAFHRWPARRP